MLLAASSDIVKSYLLRSGSLTSLVEYVSDISLFSFLLTLDAVTTNNDLFLDIVFPYGHSSYTTEGLIEGIQEYFGFKTHSGNTAIMF